jgi:predicted GIY-YIG superfamily endonuclease
MTGVYLLHFEPPYRHARHYLGFSADIDRRVSEHQLGTSRQPLISAALNVGTNLVLTRTWEGADRNFERKLKNKKNTPKLCPVCTPTISL